MTPKEIADQIIISFDVQGCKRLRECIEDIIKKNESNKSYSQISEIAEELEGKVRHHLQIYFNRCRDRDVLPKFYFSESDPDILVGSCRQLKDDTIEKIKEKKRLSLVNDVWNTIEKLESDQFEALCGGIFLRKGLKDVKLNKHTWDKKVDIYAKREYWGKEWLHIAQAKRYSKDTKLSSDVLRLLAEIVYTLRKNNFNVDATFFTTAQLSSEAWIFSKRNHIEVYDGEKIANFIAKEGLGFTKDEKFSENKLFEWINSLKLERVKPDWLNIL